jgi:hypothetical protein
MFQIINAKRNYIKDDVSLCSRVNFECKEFTSTCICIYCILCSRLQIFMFSNCTQDLIVLKPGCEYIFLNILIFKLFQRLELHNQRYLKAKFQSFSFNCMLFLTLRILESKRIVSKGATNKVFVNYVTQFSVRFDTL